MATITEAGLQGDWFYIEEEQSLDRASPEFFILREGVVRSSRNQDVVGSYEIMGDAAVLTFSRREHSEFVMTLHAPGDVFDEATPSMHANAAHRMEAIDETVRHYGTFVRRTADDLRAADIWHRVR